MDDFARELPRCRWFTRGWTLQELIVPKEVIFFDKAWNYRGAKRELASLIGRITKIPESDLRHEEPLSAFSVAKRMSWAAQRMITLPKDMAYCLLGIFDANMPLMNGEGPRAFERLQLDIMTRILDLSILAWVDDRKPCPEYSGVLAESPK